MLNFFNMYIDSGLIIRSDGYPSYPRAVIEFGSHQIVNHSVGFKNSSIEKTNSIENVCSRVKGAHGSRIDLLKQEFSILSKRWFEETHCWRGTKKVYQVVFLFVKKVVLHGFC